MSWKATAHVKPLTHHPDGAKLTAREKLILFVLADSHNEDRGNCAWISVPKAAEAALTSERRFSVLLKRLEAKGSLIIARREGKTNLYYFPGLETPPQSHRGSENRNVGAPPMQLRRGTPATATAPKPLEPSGTDIAPPLAAGDSAYEEKIKTIKQRLDDYHQRRWQKDEDGKRFLISPSSGQRVYEEALA